MSNQKPPRQLSSADRDAQNFLLQRKPETFEDHGKEQTYPYRRVIVLLLTWKDADNEPQKLEILRNLEKVYRDDYRFDVLWYQIPTHNPQAETEKVFEKYRRYFDDPSTLLIVHYYGHGGFHNLADPKTADRHQKNASEEPRHEEKMLRLRLAAWNSEGKVEAQIKRSPKLDWSRISSDLQTMKSDVIVWMDSCHSAGAFRPTESQGLSGHRMEIISACGYPGKSRNARLTKTASQELISKANEAQGKPFTVATLYRSVLGSYMNQNSKNPDLQKYNKLIPSSCPTPVYINMSKELEKTTIPLMPFKEDTQVYAIPLQSFLVRLPRTRKLGTNR